MQTSDNLKFTFVLLVRKDFRQGACGVGKSSILHRFRSDKFNTSYEPTIWDTYRLTKIFDGQETELEIIDTAGFEGPESPTTRRRNRKPNEFSSYGFILVYDICDADSYRVSIEMLQEIRSDTERCKITCVLVGNKTDREVERQVSQQQAELAADKLGTRLVESSARAGENIELVFFTLIEEIQLARMIRQSNGRCPTSGESSDSKVQPEKTCKLI